MNSFLNLGVSCRTRACLSKFLAQKGTGVQLLVLYTISIPGSPKRCVNGGSSITG
jgi:hypothetical protein